MPRSCKVAVVGAGVSGLAAARELRREGHQVVVFEKSDRVGGTWVYSPRSDSDLLGVDPDRRVVHSSLYRSLRTNLPRPLMGLLDYPMPRGDNCYVDPRMFPGHREVLAFLEDFARSFGLFELVRFRTEVVRVRRGPSGAKDEWVVESRREGEPVAAETFQAVVVCNGHCTEPRTAKIPGIDRWPRKQIHSHNYRIPEPFQNQVVVLIGTGPSAHDISRDISKVAREVHLASRSLAVKVGKLDGHDNIWQHLMIRCVYEDGKVDFNDGSSVFADVILHCTGYKYHFPFLEPNKIVSIDDNSVEPLYEHVFPPGLAPWISFVGLLNRTPIFLTIDLQSKWIARVLSGKVDLPPVEEMISSVKKVYEQLEDHGIPKHLTHFLHPNEDEYLNSLVAKVGLPPLEEWTVQMYRAALMKLSSHDDWFRDTWDADYWDQQSDCLERKQSC